MNPGFYRALLGGQDPGWRPFEDRLVAESLELPRVPVEVLQVNVGKRCNQACSHCHVDAGPKRTEEMSDSTVERLVDLMDTSKLHTLDITGGAPELHPGFRRLVRAGRERGLEVIDRCNLTVLFEPGQEDTASFLASQGVAVVASLPCYTDDNVDKQRGKGVFGKSIAGLVALNALGYGRPGSGLVLDLVYNPGGAFLPPAQGALQADYKRVLEEEHGVVFNSLLTITNMPIKRWAAWLRRQGKLDAYMHLLAGSFNPDATAGLMCRNTVSIGFDGVIYDCDFNQMLEIGGGWKRRTVWDIASLSELERVPIAFDDHCYGCTAGAGSSCGGATT
jgi:radical SAM/Cys-rich protein